MRGMATSHRRYAPKRLVSSASRTRSRSASTPRWPSSLETPALFTRTSSLPNVFSTKDASRPTLFSSETSSPWTTTLPESSSAAFLPLSSSREPRIVVMLLSASWRTISSPIPLLPPLTSATRQFSAMQPPDTKLMPGRYYIPKASNAATTASRGDVLPEITALQGHHRAAHLEGEAYLGERPVLAADRDHRVPRTHHPQVSRIPYPCSNGEGEKLVRLPTVLVGQDADGRPAGLRGTAGGGFHHAGASPADDRTAPLSDEPAHLPSFLVELAVGIAGPNHRDVRSGVQSVG